MGFICERGSPVATATDPNTIIAKNLSAGVAFNGDTADPGIVVADTTV